MVKGPSPERRATARLRLTDAVLVAQQAGEARGSAEFPGQRTLLARPVERLPKMILGRRRGSGRILRQKELAFDAH